MKRDSQTCLPSRRAPVFKSFEPAASSGKFAVVLDGSRKRRTCAERTRSFACVQPTHVNIFRQPSVSDETSVSQHLANTDVSAGNDSELVICIRKLRFGSLSPEFCRVTESVHSKPLWGLANVVQLQFKKVPDFLLNESRRTVWLRVTSCV